MIYCIANYIGSGTYMLDVSGRSKRGRGGGGGGG